MNFLIDNAWAQTAQSPTGGSMGFIIMMGLFFVIFYFMLIRPQSKRAKEHRTMLAALASGDEVVTSGGILGRVVEVGESFVTIEVADDVKLKVQKHQVSSIVPKGTFKSA